MSRVMNDGMDRAVAFVVLNDVMHVLSIYSHTILW